MNSKKIRTIILCILLIAVLAAPSDVFFRSSYRDSQDFVDSLTFLNRLLGGYGNEDIYCAKYINVYGQHRDILLKRADEGFVRLPKSEYTRESYSESLADGSVVIERFAPINSTIGVVAVTLTHPADTAPPSLRDSRGTLLFGRAINEQTTIYLGVTEAPLVGYTINISGVDIIAK